MKCQNCQAPTKGRSDKKFCTDICKSQFNNQRKKSLKMDSDKNPTKEMTEKEAIITLAYFNDWRRGEDIPMPKAKDITKAIEVVIDKFKERNNG